MTFQSSMQSQSLSVTTYLGWTVCDSVCIWFTQLCMYGDLVWSSHNSCRSMAKFWSLLTYHVYTVGKQLSKKQVVIIHCFMCLCAVSLLFSPALSECVSMILSVIVFLDVFSGSVTPSFSLSGFHKLSRWQNHSPAFFLAITVPTAIVSLYDVGLAWQPQATTVEPRWKTHALMNLCLHSLKSNRTYTDAQMY